MMNCNTMNCKNDAVDAETDYCFFCFEARQNRMIIADLKRRLYSATHWIPVSERLPEHMKPVFFSDGIGHYDEEKKAWYSRMECPWPYRRCTYAPEKWMPLPQ